MSVLDNVIIQYTSNNIEKIIVIPHISYITFEQLTSGKYNVRVFLNDSTEHVISTVGSELYENIKWAIKRYYCTLISK